MRQGEPRLQSAMKLIACREFTAKLDSGLPGMIFWKRKITMPGLKRLGR